MANLPIYVHYTTNFSSQIEEMDITFSPGYRGTFGGLYDVTEPTVYIGEAQDIPNRVFASHNDAINYFYGTHAATIQSDMETLTGLTFDSNTMMRADPENWDLWIEFSSELSGGLAQIYNFNEAAQSGIAAVNVALAEHVVDPAAHAELFDLKVDKVTGKGLSTEDYTSAEKTKLSGIASGATANDTDANLKARANHTGSQAISTVTGLQTSLDGKAESVHSHVANDISNATTIGKSILTASAASNVRTAIFSTGSNIADSVTNAPTDASTNNATSLPTDYNALTGLLGLATGLNDADTAINNLSAAVDANATKQNTGFAILNTLAGKFNLSLDILEANTLMAA
jgi:hypothetical protein